MAFRCWHLLPIAVGVWFPITFLTSYVIAVLNDDVEPIFLPYISDTGSWSPESCIFGLMLTIGSILLVFVIYIRYRQVREIRERNNLGVAIRFTNYIALHIGIWSLFGMLIVATFQEVNVFSVHIMGAFLCFATGATYLWIQVCISFKISAFIGSKFVNIIRLILVVITTVTFLLSSIFGGLAFLSFRGNDITKWKKEHGGYTFHVISTVSEWIMAILTMVFFATFYKEFRLIGFKEPEIVLDV